MPHSIRSRGDHPRRACSGNGALRRRAFGVVAVVAGLLAGGPTEARAVTVIVPDDWPTIQQAIDSGADEVLVRPGVYPETLVIARAMNVKGLVPYGTDPDALPVIAGLVFEDFNYIEFNTMYLKIWSLRILSQVRNQFETSPFWDPLDIELAGCALDGGLADSDAAERGQIEYYLRLCRIDGPIRLSRPLQVWIEDCSIHAPIVIASYLDQFVVKRCRFKGPHPFAIDVIGGECEVRHCTFESFQTPIRHGYSATTYVDDNVFVGPGVVPVQMAANGDLSFSRNHVTGFDYGVLVPGGRGDLYATWNVIENCGTAVRADVRYASFLGNEVRSCETGVVLNVLDGLQANDNVVRSCGGDGMVLLGSWSEVNRNSVGGCRGDGIRLTSDGRNGADPLLVANTVFRNGGSGLVLNVTGATRTGRVHHNIAHANAGHGLEFTGPGSVQLGCNDWFENAAGAVSGAEPGATDLALDPLFCDATQDDVHLSAGSPLLNPAGCGPIGALGQGCDVPASVRLASFAATPVGAGIEVRWQVADAAPGFTAWLERADRAEGPWSRVDCERSVDGAVTVDLDRTVAPAKRYWYRLLATDRAVTRSLGAPIEAAAEPPERFALSMAGPNPSPSTVEVEFALATAANIALDVFDPQGRHVVTLARGQWPAGVHRASWSDAGRAPAGLYFLRYRHPAGQEQRRILLVR